MKKRVLLFAILIIILILSACGESEDEASNDNADNTISVEVAKVKKDDLKAEKSLYGQTQPIKQTPIMLSAPGEVKELNVDNGEKIEKDKKIAVITTEIGDQTIKAPSKGTVAGLPDSTGAFVSNEEPFAMMLDLTDIKVQATMTQKMRNLFEKDQEVTVEINQEDYKGKVLALDPLPNENGELVLNVRVENEDDKITSGESARITVNKVLKKDTLIVPSEAVLTTDEESYVYLVNDGKAKKVTVEILETQSKETAIKADLKQDDEIIVTGQSLVSDEQEVDIQKDGDKS